MSDVELRNVNCGKSYFAAIGDSTLKTCVEESDVLVVRFLGSHGSGEGISMCDGVKVRDSVCSDLLLCWSRRGGGAS